MKGFPATAVLDDIMVFVDKICQSENVHMRRMKDGTFKVGENLAIPVRDLGAMYELHH